MLKGGGMQCVGSEDMPGIGPNGERVILPRLRRWTDRRGHEASGGRSALQPSQAYAFPFGSGGTGQPDARHGIHRPGVPAGEIQADAGVNSWRDSYSFLRNLIAPPTTRTRPKTTERTGSSKV